MRQTAPEGIRITKVGLWYVLFTVIVAVAATNTGNNALYMVLAVMLAVLVLSGVVSRNNLRGLKVELEAPDEIFARTPFHLYCQIFNRGRLLPRWLLLFSVSRDASPALIPYLGRRQGVEEAVELMIQRRGRHRFNRVHLASLFPLGFFRKGMKYQVDLEVLVYPEIYSAAVGHVEQEGNFGEESTHRAGWGHELHALRSFRPGDDPRGIHWKQTARTGSMVYMEKEAEESRRLSIVLDNAVGELQDAALEERFERLVSEAATAVVDYLERGFEVELVTRDQVVPFGSGRRQRLVVLEALALIQTRPFARTPLVAGSTSAPQLRLAMESAKGDREEARAAESRS